MKSHLTILLFIAVSAIPATGAMSVAIVWYNFNSTDAEFRNRNGNLLTAGTSAAGDGAVLQLGYHVGATQANPFVGAWVALTGPGTGLSSTIGDIGSMPNGTFNFVNSFQSDFPNVPAIGTPLAIRFYDTTSLATANYFNSVSNADGTWNWNLGTPKPTVYLTFKASPATLVWQGGAGSAFRTTLPVPEPGVAVLLVVGGAGWVRRRRVAVG